MLDKKRISAKIDELNLYIDRIEKIAPILLKNMKNQ